MFYLLPANGVVLTKHKPLNATSRKPSPGGASHLEEAIITGVCRQGWLCVTGCGRETEREREREREKMVDDVVAVVS